MQSYGHFNIHFAQVAWFEICFRNVWSGTVGFSFEYLDPMRLSSLWSYSEPRTEIWIRLGSKTCLISRESFYQSITQITPPADFLERKYMIFPFTDLPLSLVFYYYGDTVNRTCGPKCGSISRRVFERYVSTVGDTPNEILSRSFPQALIGIILNVLASFSAKMFEIFNSALHNAHYFNAS